MPYVSLIVEALRARPVTVFWIAALSQAALWVLVPALFYASPPGDLPQVLAIGREWRLGSWHGPPLAFWLADLAFRLAGGSAIGPYLLSQACVVVALWAVFTLGRAIVGVHHAVLATLLMTGIVVFTAPTPEFGPAILALPLWALALKHYWFALGEARRRFWILLGIDLGLLLLTTYWSFLLLALLIVFLLATPQGRAAIRNLYPLASLGVALVVALPHLVWLYRAGSMPIRPPTMELSAGWLAGYALLWLFLILVVTASHFGMGILAMLASGAGVERKVLVPAIERPPVEPFAMLFVYVFAIAPPLLATIIWAALDQPLSLAWAAVFVLLSSLAVIVGARNPIPLHRQNIVGVAWFGILVVPPLAMIIAILLGPWTFPYEINHQQPSATLGQFFTETFRRRVGKPLEIVVGDARPAFLLAISSPDRPRIYSAVAPENTPWLTDADIRSRGAVVVWPVEDQTGQPPVHLLRRFPDLVPEVPRTFPRPVPGILSSYRIGWAVIRPQQNALNTSR